MTKPPSNVKHGAIVVLGGSGARFGQPKQLYRLAGGKSLGHISTLAFLNSSFFERIVVVVRSEDREFFEDEFSPYADDKRLMITTGGKTRSRSVWNGLLAMEDLPLKDTFIWVHDGARPALCLSHIENFKREVELAGSLVPVLPISDTVKRVTEGVITGTEKREELFRAQTPQIFKGAQLFEAYYAARNSGWEGTDESSYLERFTNLKVHPVKGDMALEKITTTQDLLGAAFSEMMMAHSHTKSEAKSAATNIRIGFGSDVHELVTGRPLILGGVNVPFEKGLKGHSDADVVIHALIDGMLGAAGMGDIGRHFPDTSEDYKDADSVNLLRKTYSLIKNAGYRLSNVDMTITAERPKLAPHIPQMRKKLSAEIDLAHDELNIKAKTAEGLGPEGRGESISCKAVILLTAL